MSHAPRPPSDDRGDANQPENDVPEHLEDEEATGTPTSDRQHSEAAPAKR